MVTFNYQKIIAFLLLKKYRKRLFLEIENEDWIKIKGHKLISLETPFFSESHLFRQDVDV